MPRVARAERPQIRSQSRKPQTLGMVPSMPRIRHIDVHDESGGDAVPGRREVLELIAAAYQDAVANSGLQGPDSWVSIGLLPSQPSSGEPVSVLVQCDKPVNGETITASMPSEVLSANPGQFAALIGDVITAGLSRLGVARGWDAEVLAGATGAAKASIQDLVGPASNPWRVMAVGRGASAPEQPHEIAICGGGPMNGVPKAYTEELDRLLTVVASDGWASWWSRSPVKLVEVFYWFDAAKPGVRVRVGAKVTAAIDRPVATISGANPIELARADVDALTRRLTTRLNLSNPPKLY